MEPSDFPGRLVAFINRRKGVAGACYILSILFSEFIPVSGTVGEIPKMLSVRFFTDPFPSLAPLPTWVLGIPAALFLAVSLLPLAERKFSPGLFLLFAVHFLFYPAAFLTRGSWVHPLVWALLLAPIVGLNLWVRSLDYFYAMVSAAILMDLGAAVRGFGMGLPAIGVPYYPALPPTVIIVIDVSLLTVAVLLWWKRIDFGRRWGVKWMEALE